MSSLSDRANRLTRLIAEEQLDLLVVSNLVNVRYLTRFSGTNAIVVMGEDVRVFGTDFRYYERVRPQLTDYDVRRAKSEILEIPAAVVEEQRRKDDKLRVGFDDAHLTVRSHRRFTELLGDAAELVPAGGLVERLRAVKDADEVAAMRRAAAFAADLYEWLASDYGFIGHTERDVALALEVRAREIGADGLSFPPIVAAGANGALPHAEPGDTEIPRDTLVIVDLGCIVDGYCSDCTRTFATGELPEPLREAYSVCHGAQAAALAEVRAGADPRGLDAIARMEIEAAGHDVLHGLGHGVGLEVHELPVLRPTAAGSLVAGNVVTVEPGVYLAGRGGVRIEDLVVVTDSGPEVLSGYTKDLVTLN
jgi:Xaa-Pro aminopeptidase